MPKVSVLTPIYNTNPEHLRECIESILRQTFTDFEFLILNDSPDNTELDAIVASYKDKRIKYHKNERNIGISASRNKLLDMARGEYLAIFDHDDISLPTRLEKEAAYLDANPDVGVVSAFTEHFPIKSIATYPINNNAIKRDLMNSCAIAHSASMIRKSVMKNNCVQWDEKFSPSEDYMLWVQLIDKTMFHNIPEILLKYRVFQKNTSHTQADKMSDRTILIKSLARFRFPFLAEIEKLCSSRWIFLFSVIPIIKIKRWPNHIKILLFGCIPLFTAETKGKL